MDELREEAVRGFIGNHYLEGVVNGKRYMVFNNGVHFYVSTKQPLTEASFQDGDIYLTDFSIDELSDLNECSLSAFYQGHEFQVGLVSAGVEKVELVAPYSMESIAKELGFDYDQNDRVTHKFVASTELDTIRIKRESIYNIAKTKLEEKKNTPTM